MIENCNILVSDQVIIQRKLASRRSIEMTNVMLGLMANNPTGYRDFCCIRTMLAAFVRGAHFFGFQLPYQVPLTVTQS